MDLRKTVLLRADQPPIPAPRTFVGGFGPGGHLIVASSAFQGIGPDGALRWTDRLSDVDSKQALPGHVSTAGAAPVSLVSRRATQVLRFRPRTYEALQFQLGLVASSHTRSLQRQAALAPADRSSQKKKGAGQSELRKKLPDSIPLADESSDNDNSDSQPAGGGGKDLRAAERGNALLMRFVSTSTSASSGSNAVAAGERAQPPPSMLVAWPTLTSGIGPSVDVDDDIFERSEVAGADADLLAQASGESSDSEADTASSNESVSVLPRQVSMASAGASCRSCVEDGGDCNRVSNNGLLQHSHRRAWLEENISSSGDSSIDSDSSDAESEGGRATRHAHKVDTQRKHSTRRGAAGDGDASASGVDDDYRTTAGLHLHVAGLAEDVSHTVSDMNVVSELPAALPTTAAGTQPVSPAADQNRKGLGGSRSASAPRTPEAASRHSRGSRSSSRHSSSRRSRRAAARRAAALRERAEDEEAFIDAAQKWSEKRAQQGRPPPQQQHALTAGGGRNAPVRENPQTAGNASDEGHEHAATDRSLRLRVTSCVTIFWLSESSPESAVAAAAYKISASDCLTLGAARSFEVSMATDDVSELISVTSGRGIIGATLGYVPPSFRTCLNAIPAACVHNAGVAASNGLTRPHQVWNCLAAAAAMAADASLSDSLQCSPFVSAYAGSRTNNTGNRDLPTSFRRRIRGGLSLNAGGQPTIAAAAERALRSEALHRAALRTGESLQVRQGLWEGHPVGSALAARLQQYCSRAGDVQTAASLGALLATPLEEASGVCDPLKQPWALDWLQPPAAAAAADACGKYCSGSEGSSAAEIARLPRKPHSQLPKPLVRGLYGVADGTSANGYQASAAGALTAARAFLMREGGDFTFCGAGSALACAEAGLSSAVHADALLRWGQLTRRAEIVKTAARSCDCKCGTKEPLRGDGSSALQIELACAACGSVHSNSDPRHLPAQSCSAEPSAQLLRCSICEEPVRGLALLCPFCGHGGHRQHLVGWFTAFPECPTGCGCNCSSVCSSFATDTFESALRCSIPDNTPCGVAIPSVQTGGSAIADRQCSPVITLSTAFRENSPSDASVIPKSDHEFGSDDISSIFGTMLQTSRASYAGYGSSAASWLRPPANPTLTAGHHRGY